MMAQVFFKILEVMEDYDIHVEPSIVEFPDGWKNVLTKYMSDKDYTIEQLLEDDYNVHKGEIARLFAKQLINGFHLGKECYEINTD